MNNNTNYKAISYSNINYNNLISDKNQELYNAIIDKKTKEQIKNKKEFTDHKFDGNLSLDITDKKPSLNSVKSPENETNVSDDQNSFKPLEKQNINSLTTDNKDISSQKDK